MTEFRVWIVLILVLLSLGCVEDAVEFRDENVIAPQDLQLDEQITEKFFGRDIEVKAPSNYLSDSKAGYWGHEIKELTVGASSCTHSMEPTIGCGHVLILFSMERYPFLLDKLAVGDIIAFSGGDEKLINHRIVFEGSDEQGRFFITKGDNNEVTDEKKYGKIREKDIVYLIVGIRY